MPSESLCKMLLGYAPLQWLCHGSIVNLLTKLSHWYSCSLNISYLIHNGWESWCFFFSSFCEGIIRLFGINLIFFDVIISQKYSCSFRRWLKKMIFFYTFIFLATDNVPLMYRLFSRLLRCLLCCGSVSGGR